MTDTEVLLAAADLIERNGLHKGDYWPGARHLQPYSLGDPTCVLGACRVVTGMPRVRDDVFDRLYDITGSISLWSDSHTQAEVVETLRAVATSEET